MKCLYSLFLAVLVAGCTSSPNIVRSPDPVAVYTPGPTNTIEDTGVLLPAEQLAGEIEKRGKPAVIFFADPVYYCPPTLLALQLFDKCPVEWTEGSWDCEDQVLFSIVMARLAVKSVMDLKYAGLPVGLAAFAPLNGGEGHALVLFRTVDGWYLFDPGRGDYVPWPGSDWMLVWVMI